MIKKKISHLFPVEYLSANFCRPKLNLKNANYPSNESYHRLENVILHVNENFSLSLPDGKKGRCEAFSLTLVSDFPTLSLLIVGDGFVICNGQYPNIQYAISSSQFSSNKLTTGSIWSLITKSSYLMKHT